MWYNLDMRNRVLLRLPGFVLLASGAGILGMASSGYAQTGEGISGIVASILSSVANVFIELGGKIFTVLIDILLSVVTYNDFINAPAVTKAWVLVRDFSNMAFLIIFIAIAFATILGVEKYEYKQLLPKLLFMAVAINFSRTLCGLVLDTAQVVMMTFVNGFRDVAAGNLIRGFGLADLTSLDPVEAARRGVDASSIAIASILAVIMLIVSVVTVGAILVVLITRIIFLWVLIILSPLAFMMAAAPGMSGKFSEWWGKFIRYAFVGPILAFFLWLSFSIMAAVNPGQSLATSSGFSIGSSDSISDRVSVAITTVSNSENILSFAIAVALLMMSLMVSSELGVKGGELASAALGKIQSGGVKLAKLGALGVATGGFGALAAYGAFKGGQGAYKGGKKVLDVLPETWKEDWDRKHGKKIVSTGMRAASAALNVVSLGGRLGGKKTLKRLKAFSEEGKAPRMMKFKEGWSKLRKKEREKSSAIGESISEDSWNLEVNNRVTDTAYATASSFIAKEESAAKDASENEDALVDRFIKAYKDYNRALSEGDTDGARNASFAMLGLEKAVTKTNGQNTALARLFAEKVDLGDGQIDLTEQLVKEMGDVKNNPENLAKYMESFHGQDSGAIMKQLATARASNDTAQIDGILADLKTKFAAAEGSMSDQKMQSRIGNRLYAKKYKIYDKNKDWADKNVSEIDEDAMLADDVVGNGQAVQISGDGKLIDKGKHLGAFDALHWQQMQKTFHRELSKVTKVDDLAEKFERDLGDDAVRSNNASFGFTTRYDAAKGGSVRLDLANAAGLQGHDQAFGGKLSTMSVGDVAKTHPMTSHIQSMSDQGVYYNENAPSHKFYEISAIAAGDARALSSQRIDTVLGYVGLKREDIRPERGKAIAPELQIEAMKIFARKYHPEHGETEPLVDNIFIQNAIKLAKTLSIKEAANETGVRTYLKKIGVQINQLNQSIETDLEDEDEGANNPTPNPGVAAPPKPTIVVPSEGFGGGARSEADNNELQQAKREAQQRPPAGGSPA